MPPSALPEQLLLQPSWLDSADPDRCRLLVVVALCVLSQLPNKPGGGGWVLLRRARTPPAPPLHQDLSGIYRHTDAFTIPPVQTSPAALETSCFSASRTTQEPERGLFPPLLSVGILGPGTPRTSRHPF